MQTIFWLNFLVALCLLLGVGLTLLGLPGNMLIFFTALAYGFYGDFTSITYKLLFFLLAIWLASELAEFFAGAWAAKSARASTAAVKAAIIGTIIGGLLGTMIIPVIGSLLGAVAGVFTASYLAEYLQTSDLKKSKHVALNATKGLLLGTTIKIITALVMSATIIHNLKW